MARNFGSDGGFLADNRGGIIDQQGNVIVNSDTSFAASPLGVAARTQALYGIPNANFNLTPPNPSSPIVANANDLPYWSIDNLSDDLITATTIFDTTTQTWGVTIDPGTAASGATLSLSTRSYLINDDNLALRQKALAVLSKSGTAGGTASQWNLQLSAIYYDSTDTALSTAIIGTALDTGTWTSMSGTTTPGGSAINAAAQYVDLTFTMTATAAVTGSAKATIKSLLLATSSAQTKSFIVTEVFTANGTWVRPIGVDFVTVLGIGAGGGGASGAGIGGVVGVGERRIDGTGGGGGGRLGIVQNLPVADASYSIGIGAGGAGGVGGTATKAAAGTASMSLALVAGSNGGATTFGSLITFPGGTGATARAGGAGGTAITSSVYGGRDENAGAGGTGGLASNSTTATAGSAAVTNTYLPFYAVSGLIGANGAQGTTTGTVGTETLGGAGTSANAGWAGGGGASGFIPRDSGAAMDNSSGGSSGGGGAGGPARRYTTTAGTMSVTGGAGGNGVANSGGGGGAGGDASVLVENQTPYDDSVLTIIGGSAGAGGSGLLVVAYVA